MPGIHELLEEYAALAPDTRTKGALFEKLIQKFLEVDPLYSSKYDAVWLWQEWPGRDGKGDTGIDLVARERYTGQLCAIQCKFYAPHHYLDKGDIDSFFTASGKEGFSSRIIVSTTDKWSKNAEDALTGQQIVTTRIGVDDLANSDIDWSQYSLTNPDSIRLLPRKDLFEHQVEALNDVIDGFDKADRGKLIMACGTGKTFTSLRIAERLVPASGSVLFLVPSIALMSQTLKEWAAQGVVPARYFAICSDSKVGQSEDLRPTDLSYPATTKAGPLLEQVNGGSHLGGITVFFSTYQSIQVIHEAQAAGLADFDLIVCDEAHRTTGVTLAADKGDESKFVRVHDGEYIRASRRLYMTATPKIYGADVKSKAQDLAAEIASMDNPVLFGEEFHRLGFGTAVERQLLTDYKVLVLAVSQDAVSAEFQQQFQQNGELNIDDAARVVGIYKALSKNGVEDNEVWSPDQQPMRRAVAFSRSIKDSKFVSSILDENAIIPANLLAEEDPLVLRSRHVDGTMNVMQRNELLDWLKHDIDGNETRILTNARCLSEGVDVPSLDAVIFLNSRDSEVDVVQSVGRVMRKAADKQYGYIILPIAVPAGVEPEKALNDNAKYKVVWQVLRALRAHDERFQAKIDALDFNRKKKDDQIQVIGVPGFGDGEGQQDNGQTTLDFTRLGDAWREAVYAKLVQKVGEREYWENWASSVADVAANQTLRIHDLVDSSPEVRAQFDRFVKGLQDNLNPSVTDQDALEMLAQHLITKPVLEALFEGFSFAENNAVAKAMEGMLDVLQGSNLESEAKELEGFYESVRMRVRTIRDPLGKQEFLKLLYQRFFAVAMKKASERLGIVYTPTEIVDFILRSVDHVLRTEFDSSISAEGVHILDPFTGTGTFIAHLLLSDLIKDADLPRKYRHELHANEINLLAYYVAAVNIEEAYHSRMGGNYVPFDGILLTDTFQMYEADDELDAEGVFVENNQGVIEQMKAPITVVVGNPPYSSGQTNADDANSNVRYPTLDKQIAATYAALSTASLKNKLYDSYIRAIRWATDRIGERGIVAFVSNGGFLDANGSDGLRISIQNDFDSLFILNLRGNGRTNGEQRRRERDNVFGQGSRATIALSILVKLGPGVIRSSKSVKYLDIGDYLSREEKLRIVGDFTSVEFVPWVDVRTNSSGDWVAQRNEEFERYRSIGGEGRATGNIFDAHSLGVATNRDAWLYSSSKHALTTNVQIMMETYTENALRRTAEVDPARISWSAGLMSKAKSGKLLSFEPSNIREAIYRPFQKQYLYADPAVIERPGALREIFPTAGIENRTIVITSPGSHYEFCAIATDEVPDLHALDTGQDFPLRVYRMGQAAATLFDALDESASENINASDLAQFRTQFGSQLHKDDIFYYVYGILHSPEYRERYAADLKKMLPRIPKVKDFWGFSKAGRELAELHINYETVPAWEGLSVSGLSTSSGSEDELTEEQLRVTKMRFAGKRPNVDKSTVVYNDDITISGIPQEAHDYLLGSRSAIEWILERYQIKTDKASGIVNDPNDWGLEHGNPRYILDLLQSIVTVSMETVRIVKALPPLDILDEQ